MQKMFCVSEKCLLIISDHVSLRGSAAELSSIKANLTERLQASDNKSSSLTEERDRLNSSLTEMTKELDRLKQSECLRLVFRFTCRNIFTHSPCIVMRSVILVGLHDLRKIGSRPLTCHRSLSRIIFHYRGAKKGYQVL